MVLSSQTPREGYSRRYMASSRRSKPGKRLLAAAGLVALVVLVVIIYVPRGAGPADGDGDQSTANTGQQNQQAGPSTANGQQSANSVFDLPPLPVPGSGQTQANSGQQSNGSSSTANGSSTLTFSHQPPPTGQQNSGTTGNTGASTSSNDLQGQSTVRPAPAPQQTTTSAQAKAIMDQGMDLITNRQLIKGRQVLSDLLFAYPPVLSNTDAQAIRDILKSINRKAVFSKDILANDPLVEQYMVQSGDRLSRVAPKYKVPHRFIEMINGLKPGELYADRPIKVIKGPFHARVIKHLYLMDIYQLGPNGEPHFVWTFPVGLGTDDSTPVGNWVVERGRKVENPSWKDPRPGGRYYAPDDPENPIGEFWIALAGTDEQTKGLEGYGIHGTIDQDSIGRQASMGCIRMRKADIKLLYHMLAEGQSTIQITP